MSDSNLRQNATASTRATIYHLCVAVARCYEMRKGQKLLIEELGDVTVENVEQIEVKQYSDSLTDGHQNFWNTLRNWLDDAFDVASYSSLILHTNQAFGSKALLRSWNESSLEQRIEILNKINVEFEKAFCLELAKNYRAEPSKVLTLQRYVMNPAIGERLNDVASKVWIEACQPALPELYFKLKETHGSHVLESKQDDFVNSLIGFVCRPGKTAGERWEITYADWISKVSDLTATYCKESRRFPRKYYNGEISHLVDTMKREDLFVQKIIEIDYGDQISKAVYDYESTLKTMKEELSAYAVDPELTKSYVRTVESRFSSQYAISCRRCIDEISDSKNFYDKVTSSEPPRFSGYDDVADEFRNGILHISMNMPEKYFRWRLVKE